MLRETAVLLIQRFYRIFIQADRDSNSGLPLDPITGDPIPKHLQIKLLYLDDNGKKPFRIQYFNLDTLHVWFKNRKEPINPLTNLEFTNKQLEVINNVYEKNHLKFPMKPIRSSKSSKIVSDLRNYSKDSNDLHKFIDLLLTENEKINLNMWQPSSHYFLDFETILFRCVLNDNLEALEELLYFNPDINLSDSRYKLKAVDLAAMSTRPNSTEILKRLLYHGALTNLPTKKGFLYELTSDIEKLNLIYQFYF